MRYVTHQIGPFAYRRLPIVECCGKEIKCLKHSNECKSCGNRYNYAGKLLNKRA